MQAKRPVILAAFREFRRSPTNSNFSFLHTFSSMFKNQKLGIPNLTWTTRPNSPLD